MTTIYKADDGTEFGTRQECIEYEARQKKVGELVSKFYFRGMSEQHVVEGILALIDDGTISLKKS